MAADHRPLLAWLRSHGVTDARVEPRTGHPRLLFTWRGREMSYVLPFSPSDRRWLKNARSELRRMLGVRQKKRSGPKRNRCPAPPPACPTRFALGAPGLKALADLLEED